jgi:hypothetical protein
MSRMMVFYTLILLEVLHITKNRYTFATSKG